MNFENIHFSLQLTEGKKNPTQMDKQVLWEDEETD